MLQQTQVNRVIPKYRAFLENFPTVKHLAGAEQGAVLRAWQGLGYNRRAKFLWHSAQMITRDYDGQFPMIETELVKLPGIGKNTAGAVIAYAYNRPVVYVETNIRTVFIHHFFSDHTNVLDKAVSECVAAALPQDESLIRAWYWALMDYGSHLKQTVGNLNKLSKEYTKQSAFHGSKRKVRGEVIRFLSAQTASLPELKTEIDDVRLTPVLDELVNEKLIRKQGGKYSL